MRRGQVSLELVVVIIVAATAVFIFGFLAENTVDSQRNILVQNQATLLAESVASSFAGLMPLQETSKGTEIQIPTTNITVFNPAFTEKCVVAVAPQEISVKVDWKNDGTDDIVVSKPTRIPDAFDVQDKEVPCGSPITVVAK